MGEEMERSVYRGDWSSELQSHLIGWSSDISLVKQIGNEAAAVCDDSMMFSEPKQICSQLQFSHELGVPSSIWGQDLLSSTSTRSAINRYCTAPVINDIQVKQEQSFTNLDSLVATSSPLATPKAADMPPSFPATVGERRSPPLKSKARPLANGNNSPLWTALSSGVSLSQEEQERSTTCNVPLKAQDSCMDMKKSNDENGPKRIRSDAHVPFTTFKVRKEKLGDKITALQQLVSPFGKTDTASVLFDVIEYIKLLHDQVTVLSTPYMMPSHELSGTSMEREEAVRKGGLRSRGLCLVPISTTLHVAKDDTPDFWAPTFGGSFR